MMSNIESMLLAIFFTVLLLVFDRTQEKPGFFKNPVFPRL